MKTDFNFRIDLDCESRQVGRGKRFVGVDFLRWVLAYPRYCAVDVMASRAMAAHPLPRGGADFMPLR